MNQRQAAIYCLNKRVYARAEHHLKEWVMSHPDDIYIHMELIWCFYNRQREYEKWRECNYFYDKKYDQSNSQLIKHFVQAEQLFYDNRESRAIDEYNAVLKMGLDTQTVRYCLGVALQKTGRYLEAQKEFEKVLEIEPHFLPAIMTYANWLFNEGRFDLVESIYKRIDGINRKYFTSNFRDAEEELNDLHLMKKASEGLEKVIVFLHKNKLKEASLLFWPIFLHYRHRCSFIITMVYLFYRNNWITFGKRRLKEVLGEDEPEAHYAKGLFLWYEDNKKDALKEYNIAIEKGLNHPLIYYSRSLVLDDIENKKKDLLLAHQLQPWLLCVRSELASIAFNQSEYDNVIKLAETTNEERNLSAKYEPQGCITLANLERLLLNSLRAKGETKKALSRIQNNFETYQNESLHLTRSIIFALNKDIKEAVKELEKVISINEYAILEMRKKDIELLNELDYRSFPIAFSHALYPVTEDNLKKARMRLEKLAKKFPSKTIIWFHIGNISQELGDESYAKKTLKKAISIDPKNKNALLLLCNILAEEKDLKELLKLADDFKHETIPLKFALDVAKSQNITEQAKKIANKILKRDSTEPSAIIHILGITKPTSLKYITLLKKLTILCPFDFETLHFMAKEYLQRNEFVKGQKIYKELLSKGECSLPTILFYGLSALKN